MTTLLAFLYILKGKVEFFLPFLVFKPGWRFVGKNPFLNSHVIICVSVCAQFISTNFNNYRLVNRLAVLLYYLTPLICRSYALFGFKTKKAFDYVNMPIYDSFAHFFNFQFTKTIKPRLVKSQCDEYLHTNQPTHDDKAWLSYVFYDII